MARPQSKATTKALKLWEAGNITLIEAARRYGIDPSTITRAKQRQTALLKKLNVREPA
jgi:hypothetical protein